MQLSKEEYARKKIHNGSSVQIEKCGEFELFPDIYSEIMTLNIK